MKRIFALLPSNQSAHIIVAIVLLSFVSVSSALVIARGVCCADDGAFALLAKNLAWGSGYASSIGWHSSTFPLTLFDSSVQTTGPTLIFPAALAIRVFGNQYWVPGAVQILVWLILLFGIYRALSLVATQSRVSAMMAVFLILVYAASARHFEQWWALLGEVPAILLIMLGFAVWAVEPLSTRHTLGASLLIGLAVTTKLLTLVYVGVFIFSVSIWHWSHTGARAPRRALRQLFSVSVLCLLPLAGFEFWKFSVLGADGYVNNIREFIDYFNRLATSAEPATFQHVLERTQDFSSRFAVSLPGMLIFGAGSVYLALRSRESWLGRLTVISYIGVVAHSLYWLTLSNGRPRYIYMGIVVLCFIASTPLLAINKIQGRVVYLVLVTAFFVGTAGRMTQALPDLWFTASLPRQGQARVTEFLNARLDQRPFAAYWGGSVTDLEYLSGGVASFIGYRGLTPEHLSQGFLLVKNDKFDRFGKFVGGDDQEFAALVARCGSPVLAAPPYAVYDCKPLGYNLNP